LSYNAYPTSLFSPGPEDGNGGNDPFGGGYYPNYGVQRQQQQSGNNATEKEKDLLSFLKSTTVSPKGVDRLKKLISIVQEYERMKKRTATGGYGDNHGGGFGLFSGWGIGNR